MVSGGGLPLFNTVPLRFGATMASIDTMMLSMLKWISQEKKYYGLIGLAMLVYSFQPVLFFTSLQYESLTVMNLLWDVMSDVMITLVGLLIFQEKIGPYKKAGVMLSFISIILMSLNDGDGVL